MVKETILIVEDDGIIAAHLHDMLTRSGYTVPEPVATGEEALAVVATKPPDLVLMDIQLAGTMNGVTAAENLRSVFDLPVVYLTTFSQDAQLQQAKITAPYGYLTKPVRQRELLATLEIALYKHATDRRLKQSEEWLSLALWGADLGMWDWDGRTGVVLYNERWAEILGYPLTEISPDYASWEARVHPDDRPAMREAFDAHLENRASFYESEHRLRHQDGHWVWVLAKGKVIGRDRQGRPLRACGTLMDISARKILEENLRQLSITDPLTGVFNRRYFMQEMDREVGRARRYGRPLSLIMLDIDHFKRINDTWGHERGDGVLKETTALVRQRLRHSDVFARWGGEEFMILAAETALPRAITLAEILQAALRHSPFPVVGPVTASFGVTEYRPDETLDQWLKRVDDLLYQAKQEGRDRILHNGGGSVSGG